MKKQLFIFIFLLSESLVSLGQNTFQKIYSTANFGSSSCLSVEATSDSGLIFVGHSVQMGFVDGGITKTNHDGDVVWSQSFGDIRAENIYSIRQTTNGDYIVAGSTRSFSVDSLNECYVLRFGPNGNVVWEKIYGSLAGTDEFGVHSINQTSDGGFIIGGYQAGFTLGMLYMKTDTAGNISWSKFVTGAIGTYGAQSIRQTTDGGYIITGNGGKLYKTDSSGDITWCKSYLNGSMSFSVQETTDGGYMLAGEANANGAGGIDMALIKTDSAGNLIWSKLFGGTLDDNLRYAQQTSDGGYLLTGFTNSFGAGNGDIYVVKTDSLGTLLWSKTFGSTSGDYGYTSAEAVTGGFIIGGVSNSFGPGASGAYLIKTDANGSSGCNDSTPLTVVTNLAFTVVTLNETAIASLPDTHTHVSTIGGALIEGLLCSGISTAVTEADGGKNNFSIAPNPATNYVTISFDKIINKGEVEFYNVLGDRIFSEEINNEIKKIITLSNIPEGIYFVKVFDGEKSECRKIIVEAH